MGKLQNEQEVLLAAADMSIQIFALESAVLRAEKGFAEASEHRKELLAAVIKVCAFNATELLSTAAKKGAFYIEEGDNLTMILSGIRRFAKYDATGLLQAKRTLAGAAAVAALGVVANEPPELLAGSGDGERAGAPAELVAGDAVSGADRVDEIEQTPHGQRGDDGIGFVGGAHDASSGAGAALPATASGACA
jgi:hypothetical protein